MLKDINSRQKIILSLTTLDHVYSCFSDCLGAEYGCGQRVEPGLGQSCDPRWDILCA